MQLAKALYGCVVSALLWYELFSDTLKGIGFEINPYDMCVANKMINGKQCTIVWYVDDVKVSHEDENIVKDIMDKIASKFGGIKPNIGNNQTYLGMDIIFNDNKTVTIAIEDYIKEVIGKFDTVSHVSSAVSTPAQHNLFTVDTRFPRLDEKKSEVFHHCVAKLLYVSKRCRLDILTAISFLCTRVTCSTEEDWFKLKRLIRYLFGTLNRSLCVGADDITWMNILIDASYAVHPDMKSHTGGCIFLIVAPS